MLSEIQKINNRYVAKQESSGLYYVFEKLTRENLPFWVAFKDSQAELYNQASEGYVGEHFHAFRSFNRGINQFIQELPYTDEVPSSSDYQGNKSDYYVSYVTTKDMTDPKNMPAVKGDIEMAVTVMTTKDIPFVTHMGIFRTKEYVEKFADYLKKDDVKGTPHPYIGIFLQSFTSKAEQLAFKDEDEKEYMITRPITVMRKMMAKEFPDGGLWVGDNKERSEILSNKTILEKLLKDGFEKFEMVDLPNSMDTYQEKGLAIFAEGLKQIFSDSDLFKTLKTISEKYSYVEALLQSVDKKREINPRDNTIEEDLQNYHLKFKEIKGVVAPLFEKLKNILKLPSYYEVDDWFVKATPKNFFENLFKWIEDKLPSELQKFKQALNTLKDNIEGLSNDKINDEERFSINKDKMLSFLSSYQEQIKNESWERLSTSCDSEKRSYDKYFFNGCEESSPLDIEEGRLDKFTVTLKNGEKVSFDQPDFYRHADLSRHYSKKVPHVIVDLKKLAEARSFDLYDLPQQDDGILLGGDIPELS